MAGDEGKRTVEKDVRGRRNAIRKVLRKPTFCESSLRMPIALLARRAVLAALVVAGMLFPLAVGVPPAAAIGIPTVAALNPAFGPVDGGTVVTITGTNFGSSATVDFGSSPATDVTVNSGTSITATSPPGPAGSVDVTVTTSGGTSATGVDDLFAYGAPTVTADYGISSYLRDDEGVYVNLFVPSRATWKRGSDHVVLTQHTEYPYRPTTQIEVAPDKATAFAVFVRIPEWAGPKTTIAVNGKYAATSPHPGQFARIQRTWKKGDRIEVEFDMPTTLQAVDPQHPQLVAAVHGPLALFAVGEVPATIHRQELAAAAQVAAGSTEWQVKTSSGTITMWPFTAINDEHYRLYLNV